MPAGKPGNPLRDPREDPKVEAERGFYRSAGSERTTSRTKALSTPFCLCWQRLPAPLFARLTTPVADTDFGT